MKRSKAKSDLPNALFLTVEVTSDDLREGTRHDAACSPVGLATRRAVESLLAVSANTDNSANVTVFVSSTHLAVWVGECPLPNCYALPLGARRLLRNFNAGRSVRLVTFEIAGFQGPKAASAKQK